MEPQAAEKTRWRESAPVRWSFLLLLAAIMVLSVVSRMVRMPTNALGHYERGVTDIEEGRYAAGIENLTRAIALNAKDADYFIARGYAKNRNGDPRAALADYDEAIKLAPYDGKAFAGRGYAKERGGDLRGAIEDYTRALKLDQRSTDAYQGRASARERLGDEEGALADYSTAIQLAPSSGTCYVKRADLHYDQGRWQEARFGFDRGAELLDQDQEPSRETQEMASRARLMSWLAAEWMGRRGGTATELGGGTRRAKSDGPDSWFMQKVLFLTGKLNGDGLIAAAGPAASPQNVERRAEAFFLAGTDRMLAQDVRRGLALFKKAAAESADFYASDRARAASRNALFGVRVMAAEDAPFTGAAGHPGTGLLVTGVRENGPGARAGLAAGDVLARVDGRAAGAGDWRALEERGEIGDRVALDVVRDGEPRPIVLTLGG